MASNTPLNRFIETFVLPLVAGGKLEVRGLIGPGMIDRFTTDAMIDGTLVSQVTVHMHAHLARVGPVGAIDLLPHDALALAAVWHNLLAMTHPEVTGRVRLRKRVREWCDGMLEWIGAPRTAAEVALRHAMLARLGEVGRVDTDVSFWAGSARYVGVSPPGRLVAWKSVRRVREVKTRVPFFDLMATLASDEANQSLIEHVRVALALSPLTDVALADRPVTTPFHWTSASLNALGDSALRGAAVRVVLTRGLTAASGSNDRVDPTVGRVRVIEQATQRAASGELPLAAAHMLVTFHLELLLTEALGRGAVPPAGHALAWDAVARLGTSHVARVVGLDHDSVERALALDIHPREALKDAPAAILLARAGFLEVSP